MNNEENKAPFPEELSTEEEITPAKRSWIREVADWIISIVIALALAFVIRTFLFTLVNVSGSSMTPTLSNGDKLYVNKLMYTPSVGDIVILKPPKDPDRHYVKRVIATEGMTVDINPVTHEVTVDGEVLDEEYITGKTTEQGAAVEYPYTLSEDEVFVMGDNRNPGGSYDSRGMGAVPEDCIEGKALFRIWPFSQFGSLYKK